MSESTSIRVRRAGPDFRWPNGARIGIVFNLAYEAWSPGKAPGIGPMGNVLQPGFFDTNAHSWASYGAVRGIQRLIRIAAANGVRTSIMVNGVLAETHPGVLKELHAAGHEIVVHSYGMDVIPVYFDEAGEVANIRRTTDLISAVTGEKPRGWISPRGTGSPISARLLAQEGYVWFGDCNDDDLPSIIEHGGARIVGIPLTMDVNDLPHSIRYGNAPAALVEQFKAILDNAPRADAAPFMLDVTAHTHVYGRPAGAWAYDAMIKLAKARDDVWIGTRMEIAEYALAQEQTFTDQAI
ncbi:polysaccharide deacetylase family protein [Rhodopseudomonas sp. P2A-2r]|uniref:polysaccharide deacetylase family protein n=1 Tax=unclassified Rhodopseudomonas TaxID=2638247 RepID=UPI0022342B4B|nr:polysaccharide deacetylase family protein [Rhodopseudomonas sp. P2A-2r]UZE50178.1 polysaccharide deacetylase family protein [Rhodopseudomonas sp. P2A-2r]